MQILSIWLLSYLQVSDMWVHAGDTCDCIRSGLVEFISVFPFHDTLLVNFA